MNLPGSFAARGASVSRGGKAGSLMVLALEAPSSLLRFNLKMRIPFFRKPVPFLGK